MYHLKHNWPIHSIDSINNQSQIINNFNVEPILHTLDHNRCMATEQRLICNALSTIEGKYFIRYHWHHNDEYQKMENNPNQKTFKSNTFLPVSVKLQPGTKIMYLNNSRAELNITTGPSASSQTLTLKWTWFKSLSAYRMVSST